MLYRVSELLGKFPSEVEETMTNEEMVEMVAYLELKRESEQSKSKNK
jgi:hypothetical protein